MKLKESVDIDVLKTYGFQLVEHGESGFKRYTKHYGILLVTICNNRLEKAIHITLDANLDEPLRDHKLVASVHQMNKDICMMAQANLLQSEETNNSDEQVLQENHWEQQMREHNPFNFMVDMK